VDSIWEQKKLEATLHELTVNRAPRETAIPSVQPLAPHTLLGGDDVDETPIYALRTNSRLNPIDFLCSTNQFHEASQHLRATQNLLHLPALR
jgi:hypothetical protein